MWKMCFLNMLFHGNEKQGCRNLLIHGNTPYIIVEAICGISETGIELGLKKEP